MIDSNLFASIVAIIISLMCSYVPGLSDKWNALEGVTKRAVMAGLMMLVAVVSVVLSCAHILDVVVCNKEGVIAVLSAFIAALVANQGAYQITRGS
ncbi:MAG TPA: hypothetical protein PKY60_11020 [Thermoflexales bacterium]|nr:hypothetical protein [Thermoflexales bacterium]